MTCEPLEAALDELYAADAGEFVTTRKRLSADLRTAGDKVGAKQLLAARRPSTSAWALNQLARTRPDLVETLIERNSDLVAAQTRPRAGARESLQDAIRAHREAIAAAADAALTILGPRANETFRNEIVGTLRAASTDNDVERQLSTGRLVREADASSGFPEMAGLTLVPEPAATPKDADNETARPERGPAESARAREAAARERREAEEQREAKRRAEQALAEEARERAARAEADATRAEERVARLGTELDAAKRELQDARRRSRKAAADAARLTDHPG